MPKVTPEEGARKLIDRARSAAPHIADQVRKVTVSPTEQAAKKVDKMRTNFLKSLDDGKVERGLRRVTLSDWQAAMINKGVPRITQGLEQAESKIIEFNRQFYPYLERVQNEVAAMPDTTLEDNIQRAVHNIRRVSEFKRE